MPDLVERLAHEVASRLRELGLNEPNRRVVGTLLEMAYLGTLRSEEGRFVTGSLTFANPKRPSVGPPLRRADYPGFSKFESPEILNVQTFVKLARAIDRWSGSIAVYATPRDEIVAWGVVDQLVQQSVMWHRESDGGFTNPGLLTVTMDGIGDISAYHDDLFLGGLKGQALVTHENDALESKIVSKYCLDALAPFAKAITCVLDHDEREAGLLKNHLFRMWVTSIARLCIGLRQRGTGGAFLLTPKPIKHKLQVGHPFDYPRLRDSAILRVLDERYSWQVRDAQRAFIDKAGPVPATLVIENRLAEVDAEDRREEMTGAVKLIASLAAVDGLVLMTPALSVVGFGVKIGSTPNVSTVYDGAGFARQGTRARKIDPSQFGTRHGSMLRYCAQDRKALGIVVSQDGYVRLIMTVRKSLVFWDNLKLLNHTDFSKQDALRRKKTRKSRGQRRTVRLGYTKMPKTIDRLMKAVAAQRKAKTGSQSTTKLHSPRLPSRSRPKATNGRPK